MQLLSFFNALVSDRVSKKEGHMGSALKTILLRLVNYRSPKHIKYYLQFLVVISKFSISGGQARSRSHSHGARRLRPRRTSLVAKHAGFYRRPALCHSVSGRSMWTRPARPTQCAGECRICAGCKSSLRPSVTWSGLIGPCHVAFGLLAAWQRW